MSTKLNEKGRVKSVRFDEETYRRIKAYAAGSGVTDSAAIRGLVVKGLSVDGLGLYSTELGEYLRTTMNGCLAGFEEALGLPAVFADRRVVAIEAVEHRFGDLHGDGI